MRGWGGGARSAGRVTGGILALGLKYGRGGQQDRSATEQTYQKTLELMARFEQRHGSCLCRVLLGGCDLRTAEGQRYFKEHDLLHKTCVGCVQTVVEVLAELLEAPAAPAGAASKVMNSLMSKDTTLPTKRRPCARLSGKAMAKIAAAGRLMLFGA